jgi:hypothetical protein
MRLGHGVSYRLVGDELAVEYADGRIERTSVSPERLAPRCVNSTSFSTRSRRAAMDHD